MKRSNAALWLLLLFQVLPFLLVFGSGALDPIGQFILQSIPLPAPGEKPGFLINAARLVVGHWFMWCLWAIGLGALASIVYVAFDRSLTRAERLVWVVSFVLGQSITVMLYCVLGLLSNRRQRHQAVA